MPGSGRALSVLAVWAVGRHTRRVVTVNVQTVSSVVSIVGVGAAILGMMTRRFRVLGAEIVGTRTELKGDIARLPAGAE